MRMERDYLWAREQVEVVTKQHREAQACQRRLKQMQVKREKAEKRATAPTGTAPPEGERGSDGGDHG